MNLGILWRAHGRYSKALDAWERAWGALENQQEPRLRALGDRALAELAELNARLGRRDTLQALFRATSTRQTVGSAGERLQWAWFGLSVMHGDPGRAYLCGPLAVRRVLATAHPERAQNPLLADERSTTQGTSVAQLRVLSERVHAPLRAAYRPAGGPVVLPAVVHWRVGHFAALVEERVGADGLPRYRAQDPTFGEDVWLSAQTLDEEASGYVLIPEERAQPPGWRWVPDPEAGTVWGKGYTASSILDFFGVDDLLAACEASRGIAVHGYHTLLAALHVEDTPAWSTAAYGPSVAFTASYNQADTFQPSLPRMSTLGPKWTFNWRQYLQVPRGAVWPTDVALVLGGGGVERFTLPFPAPGVLEGVSNRQRRDRSRLQWSRATGEALHFTRLVRQLSSGATEQYDQRMALESGLDFFLLTEVADPQGRRVRLAYDANDRLSSITDAEGRSTTLSYERSPNPSDPSFYQLTRVTTSDGRSAIFTYGSDDRLAAIQDMGGLRSTLRYGTVLRGLDADPVGTAPIPDVDFPTTLQTPYGETHFATGWAQDPVEFHNGRYNNRWLETTLPDGSHERIEYHHNFNFATGHLPNSDPPLPGSTELDSPVPQSILDARVGSTVSPNTSLGWRNSLFWDARALARARVPTAPITATPDVRYARLTHWLHSADGLRASGYIESTRAPNEPRVWYWYQGQTAPAQPGEAYFSPTIVATRRADGTQEVLRMAYNDLGHVTEFTDPVGRVYHQSYHPNQIDVERGWWGGGSVPEQTVLRVPSYVLHQPTLLWGESAPAMLPLDGLGATRITYNDVGQPLEATRPDGRVVRYVYDTPLETGTRGLLRRVEAPGGTSLFEWNARRMLSRHTTPQGVARSFVYDDLDRLQRIAWSDGTQSTFTFNRLDPSSGAELTDPSTGAPIPALEATVVRDREDHVHRRSFDSLRRLVRSEDPNALVTRYEWCCATGLHRRINPRGAVTEYLRDPARFDNRVTRMRRPDGTEQRYEYDNAGQHVATQDDRGLRVEVAYALDGRVVREGPPGGGQHCFTWDPVRPRLTSAGTPSGSTCTPEQQLFYYPPGSAGAGGVSQTTGPWPWGTQFFSYDSLGRATARSTPDRTIRTWYDPATDRVSGYGDSIADRTAVNYPSPTSVEPSSATFPGGAAVEFEYTIPAEERRLSWLQYRGPPSSPAVAASWSLWYTPSGRVSWETDSLQGVSQNFWYDQGGRLLWDDRYFNTGSWWSWFGSDYYVFDSAGNRERIGWWDPWGVGSYESTATYDDADNLLSRFDPGWSTLYLHDAEGNVTSDGARSYTWDAASRLTSITQNTFTWTLSYDAFGRLKTIASPTETQRLLWDGLTLIEVRDGTDTPRWQLHPDRVDQRIGGGDFRFIYLRDVRGSIRGMMTTSGSVVRRYDYSDWGERYTTWADPSWGSVESPLGFAGYFYHAPTGLYLTPSRVYDPHSGRWLSRDPAGYRDSFDGHNAFAYVGNDPVNYTDSAGTVAGAFAIVDVFAAEAGLLHLAADVISGNCGAIPGDLTGVGLGVLASTLGPGAGARLPGSRPWLLARRLPPDIPPLRGITRGFRDPSLIDEYRAAMRDGSFAYSESRAIIAAVRDPTGTLHITEGHHRTAAALEIYRETGDRAPIDNLLRNALLYDGPAPYNSRPLPARDWWGAFRNWVGY